MYHHFIYHSGRTVDQAVSRLPVNKEALFRFLVSPYECSGGCCDRGQAGFLVIRCSSVSVAPNLYQSECCCCQENKQAKSGKLGTIG